MEGREYGLDGGAGLIEKVPNCTPVVGEESGNPRD